MPASQRALVIDVARPIDARLSASAARPWLTSAIGRGAGVVLSWYRLTTIACSITLP
ncbi:MAG: hypothetical protein LW722_04370 [Rubrivivax sp.]|nr:hypothetical protein [Rubrivivax sp.]